MSNEDDLRSFVPKGMKQVTVGRETISMYNVEQINCPTIPGPEKTYAYHQNKLNLEASALNYQAKIQTLASSTGCTSLANVLRAHWNRVANAAYRMAGQITGVSYHGRNGVILDDATTDDGVTLRPTDGVVIAARRCEGIHYIKIRANLDFTAADVAAVTPVPFEYFIKVPCVTQVVNNAAGVALNLNTWHGAINWAAGDQAQLNTIFDNPLNRSYPFDLVAPSIDDVNAEAVIKSLASEMSELAYETSWIHIT